MHSGRGENREVTFQGASERQKVELPRIDFVLGEVEGRLVAGRSALHADATHEVTRLLRSRLENPSFDPRCSPGALPTTGDPPCHVNIRVPPGRCLDSASTVLMSGSAPEEIDSIYEKNTSTGIGRRGPVAIHFLFNRKVILCESHFYFEAESGRNFACLLTFVRETSIKSRKCISRAITISLTISSRHIPIKKARLLFLSEDQRRTVRKA